jgi:alkylated DNA repair dioxygenase AlkB
MSRLAIPSLFDESSNSNQNLLPYDGIVNYYGAVFSQKTSIELFQSLLTTIHWEHDEVIMFGKKITTKRKVAWYGDEPFAYTYSQVKKTALPWNDSLISIKQKIEALSGETYNSCLLNLYHDGSEGMGWHTDDEKELKKEGAIASISLGVARKFCFQHKSTLEKVDLLLDNGSMLVMKGATQTHWLHRLPPSTRIKEPRINLTFRTIIG